MEDKTSTIQIILVSLGCLFMLTLPVFAILAIWGFDLTNLQSSVEDVNPLADESPPASFGKYNFEVSAGEDALLTSTLLNEGRNAEITRRDNPAILIKMASADIEGPIVYGKDGEELLRQGFWHYPSSAYPGDKRTSYIFGHRRYHLPPAKDTFYNLDKVKEGERIEIKLQDGSWLEYTVVKTEVIWPDELHDLLSQTEDEFYVKFITCTPLGTSDQRLVVTARKAF